MSGFRVPSGPGEAELTEKRSRFLGHLRPIRDEEEARAFIQDMKKQYHDARHNCWCWRIGNDLERFSDDGEPQGSAGKPMLEVFRREEVTNLVCVVTRYFGGVLLGTGGLSRAYGGAAKEALLNAGTRVISEWTPVRSTSSMIPGRNTSVPSQMASTSTSLPTMYLSTSTTLCSSKLFCK